VLRRWHINRVPAVIAVVGFAFAVILGISALIGTQLAGLARDVPLYQANITEKIHALKDNTGSGGVVGRAAKTLSELGNEIAKPADTTAHGTEVQRLVFSNNSPFRSRFVHLPRRRYRCLSR